MKSPIIFRMNHAYRYNLLGQIPIVGKLFRDFDKSAGEKGIHKAAADVIKKSGTKLIVHGLIKDTIIILKSKPVILIANHPFDFELIPLIAALPKRDDIFTIVASDLMGAGPNTTSYFIPMFIHKYFDKGSNKLSVKVAKLFHLGPSFSPSIEHRKNVENMVYAASKIKNGGLVIIFPAGIRKKGNPWFSGVGYLLHAVFRNKNAFYARAYIQGTSSFDVFRLIPIVNKFFPPLSVYFDSPREISVVLQNTKDPKEITKNLQADYNRWVFTISKTAA